MAHKKGPEKETEDPFNWQEKYLGHSFLLESRHGENTGPNITKNTATHELLNHGDVFDYLADYLVSTDDDSESESEHSYQSELSSTEKERDILREKMNGTDNAVIEIIVDECIEFDDSELDKLCDARIQAEQGPDCIQAIRDILPQLTAADGEKYDLDELVATYKDEIEAELLPVQETESEMEEIQAEEDQEDAYVGDTIDAIAYLVNTCPEEVIALQLNSMNLDYDTDEDDNQETAENEQKIADLAEAVEEREEEEELVARQLAKELHRLHLTVELCQLTDEQWNHECLKELNPRILTLSQKPEGYQDWQEFKDHPDAIETGLLNYYDVADEQGNASRVRVSLEGDLRQGQIYPFKEGSRLAEQIPQFKNRKERYRADFDTAFQLDKERIEYAYQAHKHIYSLYQGRGAKVFEVDADKEEDEDAKYEEDEDDDPHLLNIKLHVRDGMAMHEIRCEQQCTDMVFGRIPFELLVRDIANFNGDDNTLHFEHDAIEMLQGAAEAELLELFVNANSCAVHRGDTMITCQDLQLASRIQNSVKSRFLQR